jgi:hypothetical protein
VATKVRLHEVLAALELATDEMSSYVNIDSGEVLTVSHEDLRFAEEGADRDMPEWQREMVAEAKRVLDSEEWLELPSHFEIHEWEIMKRFGDSLASASSRADIMDAIHGSGAFRVFKSTIRRLGIEKAWFAYKQQALEDMARAWLARHELEIDESPPVAGNPP